MKVPKISIIIKNGSYKQKKVYLLKYLNIFKTNYNDDNFEINFLISKNLSKKYNNITNINNNYLFNKKNIKILEIENNENYIEKIIHNNKGKYTII